MAGDGPFAPPAAYHRTNGDFANGICVPPSAAREVDVSDEIVNPDADRQLSVQVHDDVTCSTRGWLMAYPSADSRTALRECLHKYDCPAQRCLKESEEAQRVLRRAIARRRQMRAAR